MQRRAPLSLVVCLLAACSEMPNGGTGTSGTPDNSTTGQRVAGLTEITITGITGPRPVASVRSIPGDPAPHAAAARAAMAAAVSAPPARALTVLGGDGTVQIEGLSTSSFTVGTRAGGGFRYISATFKVRNAHSNGTAYADPVSNLTFLAVSKTSGSLSGSAISTLNRFDGSAATAGLALQVKPTGAVILNPATNTMTGASPDVIQVYTENELATGIPTPPGTVASVLPYGFVVRTSSTSDRTLAGNPVADQFDGIVTFAFKVPLQAAAADDPFTITATFLPVADSYVYVTRSPQEADGASAAAYAARVASLTTGNGRTVYFPDSPMCDVRTAGLAGAPTAIMAPAVPYTLARTPAPYAGGASFISAATVFDFTTCAQMNAPTPATWAIQGTQSGRLQGSYTGGSSPIAPVGAFLPGEEVEVTLTAGVTAIADGGAAFPHTVRYRVQTNAPATGLGLVGHVDVGSSLGTPWRAAVGEFNGDGRADFVSISYPQDKAIVWRFNLTPAPGDFSTLTAIDYNDPTAVATGDLDGDGDNDVVLASAENNNISVYLNDGTGNVVFSGSFGAGGPQWITLTDLNNDGILDLIYITADPGYATTWIGVGDGSFNHHTSRDLGFIAHASVAGDFDHDGKMDIAVTMPADDKVQLLKGDGEGGVDFLPSSPVTVGDVPWGIAAGDFNEDGRVDLAVAEASEGEVAILLGDGAGGFSATTPISVGGEPHAIEVGDMNGDDNLDVVVTNYTTDKVAVFHGDGTGAFTVAAGSPFVTGDQPNSVGLGDFDGDGTLDILTSNYSTTITVYLNP